jgi:hypothetical protein
MHGLFRSEFFSVRFNGDIDRAQAVYEGTQAWTAAGIAEIVYWVATLAPAYHHSHAETDADLPNILSLGLLSRTTLKVTV